MYGATSLTRGKATLGDVRGTRVDVYSTRYSIVGHMGHASGNKATTTRVCVCCMAVGRDE